MFRLPCVYNLWVLLIVGSFYVVGGLKSWRSVVAAIVVK